MYALTSTSRASAPSWGDDALQLPGGQAAPAAQLQGGLAPPGGRVPGTLGEPAPKQAAVVGRQRDGARPLPLAGPHVHRAGALGGGHVVDVERGGLGRPQPGPGQHSASSARSRVAPGPTGGAQQPADLVFAQGAGSARRPVDPSHVRRPAPQALP
jgi:hypothetical protein